MGWKIKQFFGLRYSLVPLVIVFVSSITKYDDSKRKCLDEYGINEINMVYVRIKVLASPI